MTLIDAVEQASARLTQAGACFGHGTDNSFDEAVWLVLWSLNVPLDDLAGVAYRSLSASELARIDALVHERIDTRKPAAYLTKEAWLQGVPFTVDERTIVPRSLIAELIADGTLDAWLSNHTRAVLDLCTGSGSLAVLAALAWPEIVVEASDLSSDALAVARLNAERHGLSDRIALSQGDGLDAVGDRRYDLILCNPPYVDSASMATLPAEYLAEPRMALAGGEDGMDFVRRLLAQTADHLADGGVLVLEIGHEAEYFEAAFPQLEFAYLPTSGGDNQVVLIEKAALAR